MNTQRTDILLLGAGQMGRAVAHDLRRFEPYYHLTVIDQDQEALDSLLSFVGAEGVNCVRRSVSDPQIADLMCRARVAIGAAGYVYNYDLTRLAIESGANWLDLGGNNDVVDRQFSLDEKAREAGVAVVPDCGLAPGMINVLAGEARISIETMDELHFRVGGLPQSPKPPLFYGLVFSPDGLANEYQEPCRIISQRELKEVDPLTGWERVYIGPPYGTLEAFHTSGGSSTLIQTFRGYVNELDYKTLRYPGHLHKVRLLRDMGLFEAREIEITAGLRIAPRRLLGKLLEQRLGWIQQDVVIVHGWATGDRNGTAIRREYRLRDEYDPHTGITAMARTTGFSAAVIARMIADGRIADRGVLRQEMSVPPEPFIHELRRRGIAVQVQELTP